MGELNEWLGVTIVYCRLYIDKEKKRFGKKCLLGQKVFCYLEVLYVLF